MKDSTHCFAIAVITSLVAIWRGVDASMFVGIAVYIAAFFVCRAIEKQKETQHG